MYLSLDVESLGVNGMPFAWAGCLMNTELEIIKEAAAHRPTLPVKEEDFGNYEWIKANVTTPAISEVVHSQIDLIDSFVNFYNHCEQPIIVADCPIPVEARFLILCTEVYPKLQFYPVLDVASMLFSEGLNAVGTYQRLANEYPAHNPLNDARQSARLMRLIRQGRSSEIR